MRLQDARELAWDLMGLHAPRLIEDGWTFDFDSAKVRAGYCVYGKKRWSVSRYLTELNNREFFEQTSLHEIAHALVGPGFGHGPVWKMRARSIGYRGKTTYSPDNVITPSTPLWWGICSINPAHRFGRLRRPTNRVILSHVCARCKRRSAKIRWLNTRTGEVLMEKGGRIVVLPAGPED